MNKCQPLTWCRTPLWWNHNSPAKRSFLVSFRLRPLPLGDSLPFKIPSYTSWIRLLTVKPPLSWVPGSAIPDPRSLRGGIIRASPPIPNFNQPQFPHFISVFISKAETGSVWNDLIWWSPLHFAKSKARANEELVVGDTPTLYQNQFSPWTLSA